MYLKLVKLAGFKSFVDPTTVLVRSQLNAVVGPNGCGKSNIVDAIRWVIGESSAKQLRGQSMTDVIFNGTNNRKPVGRAMVELHFDNQDGRIGGEYAQYAEVALRREVERDGQSSYYLNGTACRRRDILDILLGTGLGPRGYSIIEQGMISQLVEAKPDEMRAHIEEVAGISKYKERRRETENRIRHTRENLERLNDIRDELIKQLRHLKRQANAAERYKVYKEEERELSAQIKALNWQSLEQKRLQQHDLISQQAIVREQKLVLQRQYEAEIDQIKIQRDETQEQQQTVQKKYYALGEMIVRLEQQIKHHQAQVQRWQRELSETDNAWNELNESMLEHKEQVHELESELAHLAPQSNLASAQAQNAKNTLLEAEAEMQVWTEGWDEFQADASHIKSQLEVATTKIEHAQIQCQQLDQRYEKVMVELQEVSLDDVHTALAPLQAELEEKSQLLQITKQSLDQSQLNIAEQRERNKAQLTALQSDHRALQVLETEYATMLGLQQAALGSHHEGISDWLEQHQLKAQSRLGQEMKVNPGWELAVETVLSGYFDAICVDQIDSYITTLSDTADGRVTLLEKTQRVLTSVTQKAKTLLSQIQSSCSLEQWLGGIYIADSMEAACELRGSLDYHESVITPDGLWLGNNWLRVSKTKDAQSGVIQREAKIKSLDSAIAHQRHHIAELEQQQKQSEHELFLLEEGREQLHSDFQRLNIELRELQAGLSSKKAKCDELMQREKRLQLELEQIEAQRISAKNTLQEQKNHQQVYREQQEAYSIQLQRLLSERDQVRQALETKRIEAQKSNQMIDEIEVRLSANESHLALLRQTIHRSDKQLSQLRERRDFLEKQLSQDDSPVLQQQEELQQLLADRLQVEQTLKSCESHFAENVARLKSLEDAKQQVLNDMQSMQSALTELQMALQEVTVRQQTIKEYMQESNLKLEEVIASLSSEANTSEWEARLAALTQRIERLGPINLAAIDEFNASNERKEYLDKQFEDLTASLETLETAIQKIDRETKSRFRETFDKVNQGFQELFPKIFGGGKASLELLENDLLKTGILVKAQPPGKRNSTIHMLSGGEKALTAIALVFSMFKLNPAPFCILDEVDAPLDDSNVVRFGQLVKEMSKEVQFLMISHNKVTIEMADHLMGITMQEPGVSRVVAVDMDEALEMVTAASAA